MNKTPITTGSLLYFLVLSNAFAEPNIQNVTLTPALPAAVNYEGTLAGKKIHITISTQKNDVIGAYYYGDTGSLKPIQWIDLEGVANMNGTMSLTEKVKDKTTGTIIGKIENGRFYGVWKSPQQKKLEFSAWQIDTTADLKIVAQVENSGIDNILKKLEIYRHGKLVQSIASSIDIFTSAKDLRYVTRDFDFDGYADLSIPLGDGKQAYWIYSPSKHTYIEASPALQKINVTSTQYSTQELYEEWGDGSGSAGMNTYKKNGQNYCLISENIAIAKAGSSDIVRKSYPLNPCHTKNGQYP